MLCIFSCLFFFFFLSIPDRRDLPPPEEQSRPRPEMKERKSVFRTSCLSSSSLCSSLLVDGGSLSVKLPYEVRRKKNSANRLQIALDFFGGFAIIIIWFYVNKRTAKILSSFPGNLKKWLCIFGSQFNEKKLQKIPKIQPVFPTNSGGVQNKSSVGTYTRHIHVFARLAPIFMLSRCLLIKFLHRNSVGSLLRVRCWLG